MHILILMYFFTTCTIGTHQLVGSVTSPACIMDSVCFLTAIMSEKGTHRATGMQNGASFFSLAPSEPNTDVAFTLYHH